MTKCEELDKANIKGMSFFVSCDCFGSSVVM